MTFAHLGASKAQLEIESNENGSLPTSEIKPFTTKAPSYVIDALDAVAGHMGMTRNALVLNLIDHYLASAFEEYSISYNAQFTDGHTSEQDVLDDLSKMLKTSPDEASRYLERLVIGHLGFGDQLDQT
jgi:hypothetical protein